MPISVRPVTTIEECRAIERLQAEIWESEAIVVPDHLLLTVAKEGGLVLLALDEAENPAGFAFGLLSLTENNRLKLASHQVGVLPAYQNSGVGYGLKLAQREVALARNLDLITWTFDPLQGRNARLNLRKLGAVCNTYMRNLYGEMRDEINQGLPSDRLRVDWWVATAHVGNRIGGRHTGQMDWASEYPILNPATILDDGLSAPPDKYAPLDTACCLVEIPHDINRLKSEAPQLALKWRLQTREIFEMAFAAGYIAIDLIRREGRNYYLLQKDWQPV